MFCLLHDDDGFGDAFFFPLPVTLVVVVEVLLLDLLLLFLLVALVVLVARLFGGEVDVSVAGVEVGVVVVVEVVTAY